jgi:hypothetical protein
VGGGEGAAGDTPGAQHESCGAAVMAPVYPAERRTAPVVTPVKEGPPAAAKVPRQVMPGAGTRGSAERSAQSEPEVTAGDPRQSE